jgi:hypothetical protein
MIQTRRCLHVYNRTDHYNITTVPVAWGEVVALMTVHAGVGGRSSTKADRAWLASLKVC